MNEMEIMLVVGARPNFMKMAPLYFELNKISRCRALIVHTGQHYDYEMSQAFFKDLELPKPDYYLGVGSGTHAEMTARIMIEFEKVLMKERPDIVVVFGDVHSTLACSITAKRLLIPVAHVEAGLRSFDETMPEEINRKLTDAVSDLLFTPSKDANENLCKEGVEGSRIRFVGNIMIDSLNTVLKKIESSYEDMLLKKLNLKVKKYALVTLHRPSNVDDKNTLEEVISFLRSLSCNIPVIFPMHPRTKKNLNDFGMNPGISSEFSIVKPMGYREFITLEKNAAFVLTDSGGIQEETTFLDLPCLTLRPNTERPVTVTEGTNELVNMNNIGEKAALILSENWKKGKVPELWDGRVAQRIAKEIISFRKK